MTLTTVILLCAALLLLVVTAGSCVCFGWSHLTRDDRIRRARIDENRERSKEQERQKQREWQELVARQTRHRPNHMDSAQTISDGTIDGGTLMLSDFESSASDDHPKHPAMDGYDGEFDQGSDEGTLQTQHKEHPSGSLRIRDYTVRNPRKTEYRMHTRLGLDWKRRQADRQTQNCPLKYWEQRRAQWKAERDSTPTPASSLDSPSFRSQRSLMSEPSSRATYSPRFKYIDSTGRTFVIMSLDRDSLSMEDSLFHTTNTLSNSDRSVSPMSGDKTTNTETIQHQTVIQLRDSEKDIEDHRRVVERVHDPCETTAVSSIASSEEYHSGPIQDPGPSERVSDDVAKGTRNQAWKQRRVRRMRQLALTRDPSIRSDGSTANSDGYAPSILSDEYEQHSEAASDHSFSRRSKSKLSAKRRSRRMEGISQSISDIDGNIRWLMDRHSPRKIDEQVASALKPCDDEHSVGSDNDSESVMVLSDSEFDPRMVFFAQRLVNGRDWSHSGSMSNQRDNSIPL